MNIVSHTSHSKELDLTYYMVVGYYEVVYVSILFILHDFIDFVMPRFFFEINSVVIIGVFDMFLLLFFLVFFLSFL